MSKEIWSAVDAYLDSTLVHPDDVLAEALADSDAAGLPSISVTPSQGKLLYMLARMCGASRILEIGTLGGYSTIWMARALPSDGTLVTLEYEQKHADIAVANIARAGFASQVTVRVGAALDSLAALAAEQAEPFDFVFIDADKVNYPAYFEWSCRLGHAGTVIVADNVVRDGAVADEASKDAAVIAMRKMFAMMSDDARIEATAIQTVGAKGYDGLAIAMVR